MATLLRNIRFNMVESEETIEKHEVEANTNQKLSMINWKTLGFNRENLENNWV